MGRPLKVVSRVVLCVVPFVVAACGQGVEGTPSGRATSSPAATAKAPTPAGQQRLVARGTILDDGSGPTWCLGAVRESLPPQCDGIALRRWTWPAGAEKACGMTSADHALVGTYDGTPFTVEKVLSESDAEAAVPEPTDEMSFDSPCPEPAGGWTAPEPERATLESQERAFETAEGLEGYAGSWIDDRGDATQEPRKIVVNVQVTGDRTVAERKLRQVWGGPICVSQAAHTEAELTQIMEQLAERPDTQFADAADDRVDLTVTFDDGTLQKELDATYGDGLVRVTSILQPYSG